MKTNRVVIVQCRLSSTRLPQKALKPLGNKTVFEWTLASMKKVKADKYFVATDEKSYGELKDICEKSGFECFAGDLNDVLKRFVDLLNTIDSKTVIRATADNPFLFYEAAIDSVELFEEKNKGKNHCDYLTYSGLPHGSGVEILSAEALKKAINETNDPYDHEHVGPALYNHKDRYVCEFVEAPRRFNFPHLRTTIDTYSDYLHAISIVNEVCNQTIAENEPFTTEQIIEACNSNKVKIPVILVPSVVKGHGTGHLHRCLNAAIGKKFFVYIPEDKTLEETDVLINQYLQKGLKSSQIISRLPDETYLPVIITDTFELTKQQIYDLNKNRSLISIDEGSDFTDYCDYLLDIIPSYKLLRSANKNDSSFIDKPTNVKSEKNDKIEKILICLGGEDPAGLVIPAIKVINKLFPEGNITAVLSGKAKKENEINQFNDCERINIVENIDNLREKLYEYDLVITHYGLTAFESVYAGCKVILLPTTQLHVNLAEKYNFAYLNKKTFSEADFSSVLKSEKIYAKLPVSEECNSLSDFFKNLIHGKKMVCPVCGKNPDFPDSIISRNDTRTYRRCHSCGIVYMAYTLNEDKDYQKSYFFEDYKKQYGKTYEEDFESIKKSGLSRVNNIKSIAGDVSNLNVLDIGCAYGPFLSAASDNKMNPFGTDISEDAINSVQNKLKFPAVCAAYPQLNTVEEFGIEKFDVVTMWYVIEHFKDLDSVLRKTASIVEKGGVFAFSTPSGEGVSAKSDKDHFYKISPTDHYTIWEPSKADKILRKYGFKVVKIVSTGHHPERFPSIIKSGAKAGSIQWKMIDKYSRLHKLGDTVEIYCIKK